MEKKRVISDQRSLLSLKSSQMPVSADKSYDPFPNQQLCYRFKYLFGMVLNVDKKLALIRTECPSLPEVRIRVRYRNEG